jgi:hypothetical protein
MELPICWSFPGGNQICDNPDGSTTWNGQKGKPKPKPNTKRVAETETPVLRAVDPQNLGCGAMGVKPDSQNITTLDVSKIQRVGLHANSDAEDDAAIHASVDGHGKGFFTLNEFLAHIGETKTPELVEYFNK